MKPDWLVNTTPLALLALLLLLGLPVRAAGVDLDFEALISNRYRVEENAFSSASNLALPLFEGSIDKYSLDIIASVTARFDTSFLITAVFDTGEISAGTLDDGELNNTMKDEHFVREAYLYHGFFDDGWAAVKAGKMNALAGSGFILDDFEPGVKLYLDFSRRTRCPFDLEALFIAVDEKNPYTHVEFDFPLSFYESVRVFGGWYHDRKGLLGRAVVDTIQGRVIRGVSWHVEAYASDADIFWVGMRVNRNFSALNVSGTFILETGSMNLELEGVRKAELLPLHFTYSQEIPTRGLAFDVEANVNLSDDASLGAFCLYMSGDDQVLGSVVNGDRFDTFISIAPYITRTNLFFEGGINEGYATREFRSAGISGRGVLAPGVVFHYYFTEALWVDVVGAWLRSDEVLDQGGGKTYGWEADFTGTWIISEHVEVSAELDIFEPGDFFDVDIPLFEPGFVFDPEFYRVEETSWRILFGVDFTF